MKPQQRFAHLALLPAVVAIFLIGVVPMAFQVYIGMTRFSLGFPWSMRRFVGVGNFARVLQDPGFLHSLQLTVVFAVLVTFLSLVIGLSFALVLNRPFPLKSVVVTSILVPQTISASIIGLIWRLMYNREYGVINHFLQPFGIAPTWLGPDLAFTSVVITSVWFASSFMTLVTLAGIEALPPDPYEAAKLDGANVVQRFRFITLPLLQPILVVAVLLQQVAALHVFGIIYTLTGGGPGDRTNVLALDVYRTAINAGNLGMGAGIATTLAVLALVLSVFLMRYFGREL
jgi:multiple sugar transport system permease protein